MEKCKLKMHRIAIVAQMCIYTHTHTQTQSKPHIIQRVCACVCARALEQQRKTTTFERRRKIILPFLLLCFPFIGRQHSSFFCWLFSAFASSSSSFSLLFVYSVLFLFRLLFSTFSTVTLAHVSVFTCYMYVCVVCVCIFLVFRCILIILIAHSFRVRAFSHIFSRMTS